MVHWGRRRAFPTHIRGDVLVKRSHTIFLWVFLLIWTVMVSGFDLALLVRPIYRASLATATWATTTGSIRDYRIDTVRDSDGVAYRPIIRYDYSVQGQDYVGGRITFTSDMGSSSKARVERFRAAYPPGASVNVHYDPRNPSDAVLSLDRDPTISMMLLFLTPFNAVMVGGWGWLIGRIRTRRTLAIAGFRLDRNPERSVLHLTRVSPSAASLCAGGLSSFVCVFLVAFLTDLEPSLSVMIVTWTIIAACAGGGWWAQSRRIAQGRYTLVIDHARQTISIPTKHGPSIEPIAHVERFEVRRDDKRQINDEPTHQVVAHLRGAGEPLQIAAWMNADAARELVSSLEREIGRDAAVQG